MLGNAPVAATIAVSDASAAKNFYCDTLGLKMAQELGSDTFICEAGGGSMILVYQRPSHEPSAATIASFQVSDVTGVVSGLEARGVKFEDYDIPGIKTENHIATMPDGTKAAWFTDPDGNIVAIGQM